MAFNNCNTLQYEHWVFFYFNKLTDNNPTFFPPLPCAPCGHTFLPHSPLPPVLFHPYPLLWLLVSMTRHLMAFWLLITALSLAICQLHTPPLYAPIACLALSISRLSSSFLPYSTIRLNSGSYPKCGLFVSSWCAAWPAELLQHFVPFWALSNWSHTRSFL